MSRRSKQQQSVSLFPFLAVLLCAMGALLVLLVITTRMIREEAGKENEPENESVIEADLPETPPEPIVYEEQEWDIALGTPEPLPVKKLVVPVPALVAPKPVFVSRELPPPPPDRSEEIDLLKRRLKELALASKAKETEWKTKNPRIALLREEIKKRENVLLKAGTLTGEMREEIAALNRSVAKKQSQMEKQQAALRRIQQKIQTVESKPRVAPNALRVVPYEGNRGTTRRAILIECAEDGLRFVPENVSLSENDLIGFHVEANPLLASVKALESHWQSVDGTKQNPYVLLVVRPDGIPAYYAARQLLQMYDQPFGYELLTQDQELALGGADPRARSEIQNAIARMMQMRGRDYDVTLTPFPNTDEPPRIEKGLGTGGGTRLAGTGGAHRGSGYRFVQTPRGLEMVDRNGHPASLPPRTEPRDRAPAAGTPKRLEGDSREDEKPASGDSSSDEPRSKSTKTDRPVSPKYVDVGPSSNPPPVRSESGGPRPFPIEGTEKSAASSNSTGSPASKVSSASSRFQSTEESQSGGSASDAILPPELLSANSSSSSGQPSNPGQVASRTLSFTREIVVVLGAKRVKVGYDDWQPIEEGAATSELMNEIVSGLRSEVKLWGAPPESFQWKPRVRFVVEPGGISHLERIRPFFEKEKLLSGVDYGLASEEDEGVIR